MTASAAVPGGLPRRSILKAIGAGAAATGGAGLLGACSSGLKGSGTSGSSGTLKIGYVSPQTGPLASFAASDNFVIKQVKDALAKGITSGGKKRTIEIVVKDSQSTTTRAAEVTKDLILNEKVDIVLASATPDTANPVADQCEANGVPNVSTIVPWEAWFFGRGKKEGESFKYTTMFFFGMKEFTDLFIHMWNVIGQTDKTVACLWPNDTDANAFRTGFTPVMPQRGYKVVDPGAYQDEISDFSAQISRFKAADAELFTCTPLPPDFQTFWRQAAQQGYRPKLATVAKVMLFPSEADSLGPLANNIATDVWWSPSHPYKSSFDGRTAQQLADDFAAQTGKQWSQALGSVYSLFEIAAKALSQASDPQDREEVAHQLQTMKIAGMSGPLDFTAGPQPGIAIQTPVGGQWRTGKKFPWDMYLVDNTFNKDVATTGDLQATS
jgi:branched-chain amino acid transport system substrate-binding protein